MKPNGRFVTLNSNCKIHPRDYHLQAHFSIVKTVECEDINNPPIGAPFVVDVSHNEHHVKFYNFYMPHLFISEEFENFGFKFKFVDPIVIDNPYPSTYWEPLKGNSPVILMEAILK